MFGRAIYWLHQLTGNRPTPLILSPQKYPDPLNPEPKCSPALFILSPKSSPTLFILSLSKDEQGRAGYRRN